MAFSPTLLHTSVSASVLSSMPGPAYRAQKDWVKVEGTKSNPSTRHTTNPNKFEGSVQVTQWVFLAYWKGSSNFVFSNGQDLGKK